MLQTELSSGNEKTELKQATLTGGLYSPPMNNMEKIAYRSGGIGSREHATFLKIKQNNKTRQVV